jgi:putative transposase
MNPTTPTATGEYYHVYNRGVDKRLIVSDKYDVLRFLQSVSEFNSAEPIGSIYEQRNSRKRRSKRAGEEKLVKIISYCLNPNHYHFILSPLVDGGIEKYMQRLGNGYTKFFNNKYKRSGALFQGRYKSIHIHSNEKLLELSAYVNLNNTVHKIGHSMSNFGRSSWKEFAEDLTDGLCDTEIILGQFGNRREYKHFARSAVKMIAKRRDEEKASLLLE